MGSVFGNNFKITTFGESHGKGVGVVIDSPPAGIPLCEEDIMQMLLRRKPGQSQYTTARAEDDNVEIYSGVFEGYTTGTPIMMLVHNKDQRSKDYSNIKDIYRPGHGDYTYESKYGIRDYKGGGRASARETIGRVCAGAVAVKALKQLGISFLTYTESIGSISVNDINEKEITNNPLGMPDAEAAKAAMEYLDGLRAKGDSAGGVAVCIAKNVMPGLGEPVFDKLDALLAHGIMSIGAVKAVEIGDGKAASLTTGSVNNDEFVSSKDGIIKNTNHAGGILAGISDGSDIIIRAAFKPTPSISMQQNTVDKYGHDTGIEIHGRHDPIVVPRALVVVEAMSAIVLFDALLSNMSSKMEDVVRFYK